jgi:hypothetical protein
MSTSSDAPLARSKGRLPRPVIISDGDKGGAGKSFLARILAYLLMQGGHSWAGFDLDPRNAHLQRFHKGMDVTRIDWTGQTSWDRLYDGIMEVDPSRVVLVDLPAQAGTVASREFPRLLATANHVGRPVLRFWSLTRDFDSVNLLAQTLNLLDLRNTFAVLNLRHATPEDFDLWLGSNTRRTLIASGGSELRLSRLPSGVAAAIDAADLAFSDALSHVRQPYYRIDIEAYLAEISREFAPVLERLV